MKIEVQKMRRHYWVASTEQTGRRGTGRTNKEAIGDLCLQLAREQRHDLTIEELAPSPHTKVDGSISGGQPMKSDPFFNELPAGK